MEGTLVEVFNTEAYGALYDWFLVRRNDGNDYRGAGEMPGQTAVVGIRLEKNGPPLEDRIMIYGWDNDGRWEQIPPTIYSPRPYNHEAVNLFHIILPAIYQVFCNSKRIGGECFRLPKPHPEAQASIEYGKLTLNYEVKYIGRIACGDLHHLIQDKAPEEIEKEMELKAA